VTQIDSRNWTGPPDEVPPGFWRTRLGRLVRKYPSVEDAVSPMKPLPTELLRVVRMSALLMLVSPLALWLAWGAMTAFTGDSIIADNSHWLILWAAGSVGLGLWQFKSRSMRLIAVRRIVVALAMVASLCAAGAYVFAGARAHAHAAASEPERTLEISEYRNTAGRHDRQVFLHQREDGTLLEGGRRKPLPYSPSCALAQRLDGSYGFSWVRVLDRSASPERGAPDWPVRREDCFSNRPLSSLPA